VKEEALKEKNKIETFTINDGKRVGDRLNRQEFFINAVLQINKSTAKVGAPLEFVLRTKGRKKEKSIREEH
jgi:hypothetical protein